VSAIHPRISLHQVACMDRTTTAFVDHCRSLGVAQVTLVTPKLMQPGGLEEAQEALRASGVQCHTVNHPLAMGSSLDRIGAEETEGLLRAIDIAASLGAANIYMVSGGRGALLWDAAAERFAALVEPCLGPARHKGVRLLVETASHLNVDMHLAHTLDDTVRLAEIAGIGVCIELAACWFEADLSAKFRRALPNTGLVQVSDYVAGDRATPNRAVPGDGMVPLAWLIGDLLAAGYTGMFDLELVGPRIDAEGGLAATKRAAERLSELLVKLGA
jgi:sugar phosphate isomerase/epimerase